MHAGMSEALEIQSCKERQGYFRAVTKPGPEGIPVPLSLWSEFDLAHEPVGYARGEADQVVETPYRSPHYRRLNLHLNPHQWSSEAVSPAPEDQSF